MSRIGRKAIPVPSGVKVALQDGKVDVQGPKGKLTVPIPQGVHVKPRANSLLSSRAA